MPKRGQNMGKHEDTQNMKVAKQCKTRKNIEKAQKQCKTCPNEAKTWKNMKTPKT